MTEATFGTDIARSFRLQLVHAKSQACRLLILVDVDARNERSAPDRIYQLYLFAAIGACLVACWLALLDGVADIALAYPSAMPVAGSALVAGLPFVFAAWDVKRCARRSPLLPSQADAAFLLGRGMRPFAFLLPRVALQSASATIAGIIIGYLVGYAAQIALTGSAAGALPAAAVSGAAFLCAHVYACLAGLFASSLPHFARWVAGVVASAALLAASLGVALLSAAGAAPIADVIKMGIAAGNPAPGIVAMTLFATGVGILGLAAAAKSANVTAAIEEGFALSALPSWEMALVSPDSYAEAVRAIKRRDRRPIGRVTFGTGARALLRRSTLSLARCMDEIPDMLPWSIVVAPAGALLALRALGPSHPAQAIIWIAVATSLIPRALGVARVYSSDKSFPLVFDRLELADFALLVLDCLPRIALTVALSCIAMAAFSFALGVPSSTAVLSTAVSALLAVAPAVCAGLNPAPWQARRRIDGTVSLFLILAIAAASPFILDGGTVVVALFAAIALVAYAAFRAR